jgi:hypothetical protein
MYYINDKSGRSENIPVRVTAIGVVLAGRADDGDGLDFVQFCGSGVAGDQETTENSENKLNAKNHRILSKIDTN